MKPAEDALSKGLRELDREAPQAAPLELATKLQGAFRLHHRRRRMARMALVAGLVMCLAGLVMLLLKSAPEPRPAIAHAPSTAQPGTPAQTAVIPPEAGTKPQPAAPERRQRAASPKESRNFIALPSFDPAIPVGEGRIVRLQMPGSALQLVGFRVNEELSEEPVIADVLLAEDGTPYAMRLINTRTVHH